MESNIIFAGASNYGQIYSGLVSRRASYCTDTYLLYILRGDIVKNDQTLNLYLDPFLVWNNLAWESGQMAIDSTRVICQRLGSLVLDQNLKNTSSDSKKFTSMGHEKIEASLESAQAIGLNLMMFNQQFVSIAMKQMLTAHSAIMAIAQSRSPADAVNLQSKLVSETMTNSAVATSKLSGSGAKLARSAIKPVLKRVKRNTKASKKL